MDTDTMAFELAKELISRLNDSQAMQLINSPEQVSKFIERIANDLYKIIIEKE